MSDHTHGWIGVDLDGTLAHYDDWKGVDHIGDPIVPMLQRVHAWLRKGREVRIFTARVATATKKERTEVEKHIREWLQKHDLPKDMPITNIKDQAMVELWDDRCVQVVPNTGRPVNA